MPLIVNSLAVQRYLSVNSTQLEKTVARLSSGQRINRSSDDAAGTAISSRLIAQVRGSQMALANAQDGINMLNIADGAYQTITDHLQRIRELSVQAGNDSYGMAQRNAMGREIDALRTEIDRIASTTQYNGQILLSTPPASFVLQIGPNGAANNSLNIAPALLDTHLANLEIGIANTPATGFFTRNQWARTYVQWCDNALGSMRTRRAAVGAMVNRLETAVKNLSIATESNIAANSRIRDADIASETANATKLGVLREAAVSLTAQANQNAGLALQILTAETGKANMNMIK